MPELRKPAGELKEYLGARFAYRVQCGACGWMTGSVKLPGIAVKLWNEAKLAKDAKGKR